MQELPGENEVQRQYHKHAKPLAAPPLDLVNEKMANVSQPAAVNAIFKAMLLFSYERWQYYEVNCWIYLNLC